MADPLRTRSALASLDLLARTAPSGDSANVSMGQRPFLGKVSLRGNSGDGTFAKVVQDLLGIGLPSPNRAETGDAGSLLWLGPDEWLLVCGALEDARELTQRLSDAFEGRHAAAIDVSSGWSVLRLGGAAGKAALQKGCTLDLDEPRFSAGHCAPTRLGNADVVLHQVEEDRDGAGAVYDIYVPRSYAVSLWYWLEQASIEYGLAVSLG